MLLHGAGMGMFGVGTGHLSGDCGSRRCPVPMMVPPISDAPQKEGAVKEQMSGLAAQAPVRRLSAPGLFLTGPGPAQCSQSASPGDPSRCGFPTTQRRHLFPVSIRFSPTDSEKLA